MPSKQCLVDGCTRDAVTRGWCHGHYQRWVRLGAVTPGRPLGRQVNFACSVDGCTRDAYARQLCKPHYRRFLASGDAQPDKPVRDIAGTGNLHHGYLRVPVPRELRHLVGGRTSELEHRLVMARLLGRPLHADESVHHRNVTDSTTDPRISSSGRDSSRRGSGSRTASTTRSCCCSATRRICSRCVPADDASAVTVSYGLITLRSPDRIRTGAAALRGRCPRPLDDGALLTQLLTSLGYQDSNLD